jgi:DNA invertase Pin-like site-specific DNA recombinase
MSAHDSPGTSAAVDPDGSTGSDQDGTHSARGSAEATARERPSRGRRDHRRRSEAATRRLRGRPDARPTQTNPETSVLGFDSLSEGVRAALQDQEDSTVEKVIGYVRVSTEEQGRSGLGLDAQRATIAQTAAARGWEVEWIVDSGASGKSLNRPGLQSALAKLKAHEADAIVVAKLDRLSRSVHDFSGLVLRAEREGWAISVVDAGIDTTTAAGDLVAGVMVQVAQWERRAIGERTKAALAEARARGVQLGRPREVAPETMERIAALRAEGLSYAAVAARLNFEGVPTIRGGAEWRASGIGKLLNPTSRNLTPTGDAS